MLKTEGKALDFQNLLRDLLNVNALKKRDFYYCNNSRIYSPKFIKSMALYSIAIAWPTGGLMFLLTIMFQGLHQQMLWPGKSVCESPNPCINSNKLTC